MCRRGWWSIVLLGFLLVIAGIVAFPPWPLLARLLDVNDRPEKADVLVTLGGDSGRELYAAELYRLGFAHKIILSGCGSSARQMAKRAIQAGVRAEDIILEEKAESTYENAVFSRNIMIQKQYRSAIVITSPYHMRRAKLVFDRVFKKTGVKLLYCSTNDSGFNVDGRCVSENDRRLVRKEYVKLLYYWLRYWQ
jgi:uncharacterized SAM-binding protein YcdF (DUF218 family)